MLRLIAFCAALFVVTTTAAFAQTNVDLDGMEVDTTAAIEVERQRICPCCPTFVTADEAAEAQQATYEVSTGILVLTGEVLLTQGASAISAAQMTINVTDGTASMEGRVRTVLQQGDN